jgi:hypothetical protein
MVSTPTSVAARLDPGLVGSPLTRRALLATAAAGAVGIVLAAGAPRASAASGRSVPAPETVQLPAGIRPEGITSGPGTAFYAGSLADGRILSGDLLTGTTSVLLTGAAPRSLRGLRFDPRTGYVWAAGDEGEGNSRVWAVNSGAVKGTRGDVLADVPVPGAGFLNDLDFADAGVWVTDSFGNQLALVRLSEDGEPTSDDAELLPLGGAWPAGGGFRANGIRTLEDGSLVLNNSSAGGLWHVSVPGRGEALPESADVQPIPVSGGPGITSGDGLERDGSILYNVRGTGGNEVAVLRLAKADGAWSARWAGDRSDETLASPRPPPSQEAGCGP